MSIAERQDKEWDQNHEVKPMQSKTDSSNCFERYTKNLSIPIRRNLSKRAFDLLFSILVLTLSFPLFLFLAFLIFCTSRGPIFYRSKRLGRGGKIIQCLKFRTMYINAEDLLSQLLQTDIILKNEWKQYQKLKNDPRITPIGRFLRKTSLDELPQFWNVIKGDLSIVGPRPPTLLGPSEQYLQEIQTVYGEYTMNILSVRPGITGVWQISGRSEIPMAERRKMEEEYAISRTFLTDLLVILKTIPAVFFSKGAF